MSIKFSGQLLVSGVLGLFITGCAMFEHGGQSAVVGNWKNSLGTVWTIKADGTFEVDLSKDGKRDAWGKYTVQGSRITLQGTGGLMPKGCRGPGVYDFKRDGNSLQFTLIQDGCRLRRKNVLMGWQPIK